MQAATSAVPPGMGPDPPAQGDGYTYVSTPLSPCRCGPRARGVQVADVVAFLPQHPGCHGVPAAIAWMSWRSCRNSLDVMAFLPHSLDVLLIRPPNGLWQLKGSRGCRSTWLPARKPGWTSWRTLATAAIPRTPWPAPWRRRISLSAPRPPCRTAANACLLPQPLTVAPPPTPVWQDPPDPRHTIRSCGLSQCCTSTIHSSSARSSSRQRAVCTACSAFCCWLICTNES